MIGIKRNETIIINNDPHPHLGAPQQSSNSLFPPSPSAPQVPPPSPAIMNLYNSPPLTSRSNLIHPQPDLDLPATLKRFKSLVYFVMAEKVFLENQNPELALKYYLLSAKYGFSRAFGIIGFFLEFNVAEELKGVLVDARKEEEFNRDLGENGITDEQDNDESEQTGLPEAVSPSSVTQHTEHTFRLAEKFYNQAAPKGDGLSRSRLTFLKMHGRPGIRINHQEANEWKEKLAKQGDAALEWVKVVAERLNLPSAQFTLALCYYNGIAMKEDDKMAYYWCEKAAKSGHSGAQNVLGNLYVEGSGVTVDPTAALKWYMKAAMSREPAAIYNIGTLFERGLAVEEDLGQAFAWYVRAALFGSINAENVLGIFYEIGVGMESSPQDALKWYKKAAYNGHPHGQYNLARCYHDGYGVEKCDRTARIWFELAGSQGHVLAQLSTAICYEYGIGMQFGVGNKKKALEWYWKAAERGNREARKRLAKVVAIEMLTPARILLAGRDRRSSFSPSSSQLQLQDMPVEILEHVLGVWNPLKVLSDAQVRKVLNYAADLGTLGKEEVEEEDLDKTIICEDDEYENEDGNEEVVEPETPKPVEKQDSGNKRLKEYLAMLGIADPKLGCGCVSCNQVNHIMSMLATV